MDLVLKVAASVYLVCEICYVLMSIHKKFLSHKMFEDENFKTKN